MTITAQDRARRIKIILFDVDGVLTDGTIWLVPAPSSAISSIETQTRLSKHDGQVGFGAHSATMVEAKGYSAHDGTAISLARLGGMKCGVITKRVSETVATRSRDLKLEFVYMGQAFKMQAVREIMAKEAHATVPASAILHLHDRDWVYAPDGNKQFRRIEVVSGNMLPGGLQEIVSGIKPGQQVVSNALVLQSTVEQ